MTAPDPQAIRDAADRADTLRADATPGPWEHDCEDVVHAGGWVADTNGSGTAALIAATPELLSVLVPAARIAADLLDAIGDPEELRCVETDDDDFARHLRRIADAAAAARGEQ